MSEQKDNSKLPAVAVMPAKVKAPAQFEVKKALRKQKFSPIEQFITYVYPLLQPREQAEYLFKMMDYVYPKIKAIEPVKRARGKANQTNIQINVPGGQPQQANNFSRSPLEMVELLKQSQNKPQFPDK